MISLRFFVLSLFFIGNDMVPAVFLRATKLGKPAYAGLPNGVYHGIWRGYFVLVKNKDSIFEFQTANSGRKETGILCPRIPCLLTIKKGDAFVEGK